MVATTYGPDGKPLASSRCVACRRRLPIERYAFCFTCRPMSKREQQRQFEERAPISPFIVRRDAA